MPVVSPEEHANALERERRLLNTRFGYEHSLRSILTRFMSVDEANFAMNSAKNRKFEEFFTLTNHIQNDSVDSQAITGEAGASQALNDKEEEQAEPNKASNVRSFILGCLAATVILLVSISFTLKVEPLTQNDIQEVTQAKSSPYRIPLGISNPPACEFMTINAHNDQSSVPIDSFDKPMPTISAYIACSPIDKTLSEFEIETILSTNNKEEQVIAENLYDFHKEELNFSSKYQLIEPCGDDVCAIYFPEDSSYLVSEVDPEKLKEFYSKLLISGMTDIESTIQKHSETQAKWTTFKS